jgi:hypothetical protein
MAADPGPASQARPSRHSGPRHWLDAAGAGGVHRRKHRRRAQPLRGARRAPIASRTASASRVGSAPAVVVRRMRRAHADARVPRRRATPMPALQVEGRHQHHSSTRDGSVGPCRPIRGHRHHARTHEHLPVRAAISIRTSAATKKAPTITVGDRIPPTLCATATRAYRRFGAGRSSTGREAATAQIIQRWAGSAAADDHRSERGHGAFPGLACLRWQTSDC